MIDVPEPPERRRDRKVCRWCEASPQACRSVEWLRGRRCEACTGNHDQADTSPPAHSCVGCRQLLGIVPRRWCSSCAEDRIENWWAEP